MGTKNRTITTGIAALAMFATAGTLDAHANDEDTVDHICNEYRRMMHGDENRMGMRERLHRFWYGDRDGRGRRFQRRSFVAIDANDDGKVTAEEASAHIEMMFLRIDTDEDGVIVEDEFTAFRRGPGRGLNKERQAARVKFKKERFAALDADKDEKVTRVEFLEAGRQRFADADADNDGKVTPWEYRARSRVF